MITKELRKKTLGPELRALVAETVHEVLNDPDFGMELTTSARKKLLASMDKKQKMVPWEEVRRKYC